MTRIQEQEAIRLFEDSFPGYSFVETPKDRPADVDGFVVYEDTMVSSVEVKCRNMTMDTFVNRHDRKWLVTADKIDRCVNISRSLGIDFRGFLYLVPEKTLMIVPIWSYEKGYVCQIDREVTATQATVNGGLAMRENAYIHVENVKTIRQV